ncbi:MAG: hypothetical protein J6K88_06645 [Oscillospiraceae bacterium]|nr:hypothetical protein [Oscillospiraceae bacterium]
MKRFNWAAKSILVVFLIISLSACQQHDIDDNSSVSSQLEQTEESSSVVSDEKATESTEEKLTEVQLLDKELREHLLEIYSNADTVNTIAEYSDKMEALIEKYNGLMRSYVPELGPEGSTFKYIRQTIPPTFEAHCKAWEEYAEVALSSEKTILDAIYTTGTGASIIYAWYEYDLYYARAEELYELCSRLYLL